jgi:hypothetical protein
MTAKKYYYVSLPVFDHKILKCAGHGAEDDNHRAFYKPYFERYGHAAHRNSNLEEQAEKNGPYRVVITDAYLGDKIAR